MRERRNAKELFSKLILTVCFFFVLDRCVLFPLRKKKKMVSLPRRDATSYPTGGPKDALWNHDWLRKQKRRHLSFFA